MCKTRTWNWLKKKQSSNNWMSTFWYALDYFPIKYVRCFVSRTNIWWKVCLFKFVFQNFDSKYYTYFHRIFQVVCLFTKMSDELIGVFLLGSGSVGKTLIKWHRSKGVLNHFPGLHNFVRKWLFHMTRTNQEKKEKIMNST